METRIYPDADAVAQAGAEFIASEAKAAIAARGRFVLALSGGRTPWMMLRVLAGESIPWNAVEIVQVDERIAPLGDPDRNLTHIRETLLSQVSSLRLPQIHAMPVEESDLERAAAQYATVLQAITGTPPVLDLIHLGLGADGHTASLLPGDPVLDVVNVNVAVTRSYEGRRRMTLTYPILNRSRQVLWLVTGPDKAEMVRRFLAGDTSIPAGRIQRDRALLLTDQNL